VDGLPIAVFQSTGADMHPGHRVEWLDDAALFPRLEEEVARARHSIHILSYIWKPGVAAERLAGVVARKAREGVSVRVLVDPIGSQGFEEGLCQTLREAGAQVKFFRPVEKKPLAVMGRNHRKVTVVDGRVGFTGGHGIGDEWAGHDASQPTWRDQAVRVEGPAVRQMQQAFARNWLETAGDLLPAEAFCPESGEGGPRAAFVGSTDVKGPASAYWLTHLVVAAAKRQLWIANAYFVPHDELLRLLISKAKEGVDVRLLVTGERTDQKLVLDLQRGTYKELLEGGVRVWEYGPAMMHSKTMLVDGRVSVVGSINLDLLSQALLEEGSLVVDDAGVAAGLASRFEADLARSREMTLDDRALPSPLGRFSRRLRWLKGER
jgi:cardiolipin synthase